jgi:spore germination protein YaaH
VKVVKANSYAGIDLDYENIAEEDKANFQIFVTSLHEKLQKDNKKLIVTVLAKDFTNENGSPTRRAQDWKFLGENADQVRIMVYDYQNIEKQIYNISPIKEIEDVVKYAQAKIPNEKISIGLPLYAYSYLDSKNSLTYKDIKILEQTKVVSDLVNKKR